MRLLLVGDDEALEILADLSRHLDYFEVSRSDELPDGALGAADHVVIGRRDPAAARALLDRAGGAGFARLLPPGGSDSDGARAILIAAELVAALHVGKDPSRAS